MTDRYKHEIYNYNYGIELNDLFGKPKEFVKSMLIGRIQDALSVDDRIKKIQLILNLQMLTKQLFM